MLLMQRKLSVFLFILFTPLAVGMMLNIMVGIGNIVHNEGKADNAISDILSVPFCGEGPDYNEKTDEPCTSVGYSMIGSHTDPNAPEYGRYHDIMGIFAK